MHRILPHFQMQTESMELKARNALDLLQIFKKMHCVTGIQVLIPPTSHNALRTFETQLMNYKFVSSHVISPQVVQLVKDINTAVVRRQNMRRPLNYSRA